MGKSIVLSEIWIYPIKSLGGISLQECLVKPKGLEYDRRWMLVDGNQKYITQRTYPKLALFDQSIAEGQLSIKMEGETLNIPIQEQYSENIEAWIWDDKVLVQEVSSEASSWFTRKLGSPCKLVYFPEPHGRPVDATYQINNEQVSLSDGFPFLIIGQESLNRLNQLLEHPIPMKRFRPNFVFTGGIAHAEDYWKRFMIDGISFEGRKLCGRCIITTIDDHGKKGSEPLKTLSTYRLYDGKVKFGQNLLSLDSGIVRVGSSIILS